MEQCLDPIPLHQDFTLTRQQFETFIKGLAETEADSIFDVDFSVLTDAQVNRVLDVLFANHIKKESKKKMNDQTTAMLDIMQQVQQTLMSLAEALKTPAETPAAALAETPAKTPAADPEEPQEAQEEAPASRLDMKLLETHYYRGKHSGGTARRDLPAPTYRDILRYILESYFPVYEDECRVTSIEAAVIQHVGRVKQHIVPNPTGVRYALHLAGFKFYKLNNTDFVDLRPMFEKAAANGGT